MARTFVLSLALLLAFSVSARAQDGENPEFTHPEVIRKAVYDFIVPAYRDFVVKTKNLEAAIGALCNEPSMPALTRARKTFADTVLTWSRAEIIRFGPSITLGRMERIAFWPDPKGIGARHYRRALRSKDPALLQIKSYRRKSAALQGLTALELLLHGKRADDLTTSNEKTRFACQMGVAIAANLTFIGNRNLGEWTENDAYAEYMLTPGFHNPFFRDTNAPPAFLLSTFAIMLEIIRDRKLIAALGKGGSRPKPRRTQWHRSGLGALSLRMNFTAMRDFYKIAGWSEIIPKPIGQVSELVRADLDRAIQLIDDLGMPLDRAMTDEASRAKLIQLAAIARTLQTLMGEETAKAIDVVLGFTWVDGD